MNTVSPVQPPVSGQNMLQFIYKKHELTFSIFDIANIVHMHNKNANVKVDSWYATLSKILLSSFYTKPVDGR